MGKLQFSHIQVPDNSNKLNISILKKNQLGKGVIVSLFGVPPETVCFEAVYRGDRDCTWSFLQHVDGSALSRVQFVVVFRCCLGETGKTVSQFNTISFCVGAATEVASWGLSTQIVRRLGRSESDHLKIYVCPHLL